MITKKARFGKTKDVTMLEFGRGGIGLIGVQNFGVKCILLKNIKNQQIGTPFDPGKDVDDFEPDVVISFLNKESFDVFYYYVQQIKASYTIDSN